MVSDTKQLRAAALALPEQERSELLEALLQSFAPPDGKDGDEGWSEHLAARIAQVDEGSTPTIPWTSARARILAAARGR